MYKLNYSEGWNLLVGHWVGGFESQHELRLFYEDALANHPYSGQQVPETLLWALTLITRPPLTIYYTIDEDARAVTLYNIAKH